MKVSERIGIGANRLFRRNGHPPQGDPDTEAICHWMKKGGKLPPEIGNVDENILTLNHPPDSPGRQST